MKATRRLDNLDVKMPLSDSMYARDLRFRNCIFITIEINPFVVHNATGLARYNMLIKMTGAYQK